MHQYGQFVTLRFTNFRLCWALCVKNNFPSKEEIMSIVEGVKCRKCKRAFQISKLKNNDNGEGKICIDIESCKKRQPKNKAL